MKISKTLMHPDYLQVTQPDSPSVFCGSDQEWFLSERQRLIGCGPSAAANILFYLYRKEEKDCCGRGKSDLLELMEKMWQYVTPENNGIPSTALFQKKMEDYGLAHKKEFDFFRLDIPQNTEERPPFSETLQFIIEGLEKDTPVAFLNLDNGSEIALEPWHWVTIAAVDYLEGQDSAWIDICDEGVKKRIDLGLWLKTTVQGGGFVYFLPVNQ